MYHKALLSQAVIWSALALAWIGCSLGPITPETLVSPPTPVVVLVTASPLPITRTPVLIQPTETPQPTFTQTASPVPTGTQVTFASPTKLTGATSSPIPTPAPPTETPTQTPPPFDFIVFHQRMWTNEENGGVSENGSVTGCGYGHQIFVWVIDAGGNPLDGVVIGDTYNNIRHISGEKGPGHALYDLHMNGYRLLVVEDTNTGRPVTSEISQVMSSNDWEIPIPWLIEAHYCATEEECLERRADPQGVGKNGLCWGHYSYEITFQRTW